MQKQSVHIGTTYIVKVSGTLAKVRLTREHPAAVVRNQSATGREIRIRTAAASARRRTAGISYDEHVTRSNSDRGEHHDDHEDASTRLDDLYIRKNNITAIDPAAQVPEGQDGFTTEKEFAKLSSDWPINRFAELWNSFAGAPPFGDLKPVKKFTDRKTAIARIWKAIHALTPTPAPQAPPVAPKKAKATKQAKAKDATPTAREGSKKAIVLELIRRTDGASLKEIQEATDWLAHTVRGFISGSLGKKMGLTVESFKRTDGDRAYRLASQ